MASLGVDLWVRTNQISIPTVHAVPHRNVMAARERLGRGLGVDPVDPQNRDDLDRLCANLLSDLTMPRATA
jgi:hypothetical protein